MNYPIAILFGLAPSFIWLLFYLRKDHHPEPNKMVLKVFFLGMFVAVALTLAIGLTFSYVIYLATGIQNQADYPLWLTVFYYLIGVGLVEEVCKYLVVKFSVLNSKDFDEPVDAMLYMIISALGFAALENIFILFNQSTFFPMPETGEPGMLYITIFRFLYATFLHALASATVGYFLALSFFNLKKRGIYLVIGFTIATLLHGVYDISIIESEKVPILFYFPAVFLTGFGIYISYCFRKLKKISSVCKLK